MFNFNRTKTGFLFVLIAGFFILVFTPGGFSYSKEELMRLYRKYKNDKTAMKKVREEIQKKRDAGEEFSKEDLDDPEKIEQLKEEYQKGKKPEGGDSEGDLEDSEKNDEEGASESDDSEHSPEVSKSKTKTEEKTGSGAPPKKENSKTGKEGDSNCSEPSASTKKDPALIAALEQSAETGLSAANQRFCDDHMKQARGLFKSGDMKRAREEASRVIQRSVDHSEARFLNAVICAKEKNFREAWENIEIAEKADPDNQKIKDFRLRLEKAHPRPSTVPSASATVQTNP